MNEFHYTYYAQEIIFGAGSVARLHEAIDRFHWQRLMLCSTGSLRRNGHISSAAALSGVKYITRALPRCYAKGDDVDARTEMLAGVFLAGTALSNVEMALHHGICHVLGGTAGVPHGIANSIMLPHVMRYNLDATAPEQAQAAEAMGITHTGRSDEAVAIEAIQRIQDLLAARFGIDIGSRVLTAATPTGVAAILLFAIGGMPIAHQGLASTVGTMNGDRDH